VRSHTRTRTSSRTSSSTSRTSSRCRINTGTNTENNWNTNWNTNTNTNTPADRCPGANYVGSANRRWGDVQGLFVDWRTKDACTGKGDDYCKTVDPCILISTDGTNDSNQQSACTESFFSLKDGTSVEYLKCGVTAKGQCSSFKGSSCGS